MTVAAGSAEQPRIVVLASGIGSNAAALIDAAADGRLGGRVVAVVTNRPDAGVLERATAQGVATVVVERRAGEERTDYDLRLADAVATARPEWIVLAGWMRLLTMAFLGRFPGRVVNLHPALPGELPGTHAIERAWQEAQQGERRRTGVMVHLVPDEGVDVGPVLAARVVPIAPADTLRELEARVHDVEHELLVETVAVLCGATPPIDAPPPTVGAHS